jgi:hypothetical protein
LRCKPVMKAKSSTAIKAMPRKVSHVGSKDLGKLATAERRWTHHNADQHLQERERHNGPRLEGGEQNGSAEQEQTLHGLSKRYAQSAPTVRCSGRDPIARTNWCGARQVIPTFAGPVSTKLTITCRKDITGVRAFHRSSAHSRVTDLTDNPADYPRIPPLLDDLVGAGEDR